MLKKEMIEQFKEKYEKNKNNKVKERVLNKVQLVDLIQDKDTKLTEDFSINIKTHGVIDQEHSGRCWLFAGLNILREKVIEKCELDNLELSGNYIAYYDKLERFNISMERLISYKKDKKDLYDRYVSDLLKKGMQDSGYFSQFVSLVSKYGIVPKSVFPETFVSSNTYEINQILSRLLRKFYIELEQNIDDVEMLKNDYMEKAYTIITNVYGLPPETFDFEYTDKNEKYHIDKNITPKEFYKKYINIDLNNYIEITAYKDDKFKYNNVYELEESAIISGDNNIMTLNISQNELEELIIKQLKTNEVVHFSCSTTSKRIEGIWIDLMERYGDLLDIDLKLDNNSIKKTNGLTNNHCMLITGANIIDNKITKWKIENSWGTDYGNKGYYIATDDWLKTYVYRVVINKDNLSPKQLEILNQEKIIIRKWDAKC